MSSESAPVAPASTGPAVEVRGLSRRYGSLVAVDHISFTVQRGRIFGLLGSNGAGKSTLVKMLTTLLPPTEGDALVAGISIIKAPAQVRAHIGYVPQMLSADGVLTGRENLVFSARLYNVHRDAIEDRAEQNALGEDARSDEGQIAGRSAVDAAHPRHHLAEHGQPQDRLDRTRQQLGRIADQLAQFDIRHRAGFEQESGDEHGSARAFV
jgi:ABC-type branched-subunit amino acid transport system ATPase component